MNPDPVWGLLGIEATDDGRAIKKAYAARLKAIDPDLDPQAFIALREARDRALGLVDSEPSVPRPPSVKAAVVPEPHSEPEAARAVRPAYIPPTPPPPPPPRRRGPWEGPTIEEHVRRIEAALHAPADAAGEEQEEALRNEVAALLRHPDLARIGRSDEVEIWLAEAIVDAVPRADGVIGLAMSRFGWAEKAKGCDCPWAIDAAVARLADCGFRDRAWKGEHGPAMRVLAEPPPSRTNWLIAWAVGEFLDEIRDHHPSVERDFDARTIAWWDAEVERRRQRWPALRRLKEMLDAWA